VKRRFILTVSIFFILMGLLGLRPIGAKDSPETGSNPQGFASKTSLDYSFLSAVPSEKGQRFPLVLILHGAGGSGPSFLEEWRGAAFAAQYMILAPTLGSSKKSGLERWIQYFLLVDEISDHYPVDPERIYLVGLSGGSLLAQQLIYHSPSKWKGAVLIAPPYSDEWLNTDEAWSFPPILFIHGMQDPILNPKGTEGLVELMRTKAMDVDLFLDEEVGHEFRPEWSTRILDWFAEKE